MTSTHVSEQVLEVASESIEADKKVGSEAVPIVTTVPDSTIQSDEATAKVSAAKVSATKVSMAKALAVVALATLLMFLGTAVLIWFSSDGDLAGSIGVGLFAAAWGGTGFGAMIAIVMCTNTAAHSH